MFKQIKTKAELADALNNANGKVVVLDFFASFCVPCKNLKDSLEKAHDKYSDKAVIYLVDTQDYDSVDLVTGHKIRNLPTLVFYKDGTEVDRFTGSIATKVIEIIDEHA